MKLFRILLCSLLLNVGLALNTSAQSAQDAFDLTQARIVNAPNVSTWPVTTALTQMSFDGSVTRVDFTKKNGPNRWPDVTPPGWTSPLEYTLWLFLKVDGQWVGSGFIQFWNGRDGSGSPTDPDVPSLYSKNWYYSSRWAPIYGHGPIQPGEQIGFMVTSGNQRDSVGPNSVQERSNVVTLAATDVGIFNFPASGPTPVPDPTPTPIDLGPINARLDALQALTAILANRLNDLAQSLDMSNRNIENVVTGILNRLGALEARPIVKSCTAAVFGIPVSCKLQ